MAAIEIDTAVAAREDARAMKATARIARHRVVIRFGRKSRA
jgi:hypothetical protein